VAYHRRAADLLSARPEQMAGPAHEAGDLRRSAGGFHEAGRTARLSAALDDALALLGQAASDARAAGDDALLATVLLERARAHEARADYAEAEQDVRTAREALRTVRDPRLDMRCLWLLGGDISVGRHVPLDTVADHNRAGLRRAAEIGDTVAQALFRSRIVVLDCSRLRLRDAFELASSGVAESRRTGVVESVARSLDGLKAVHAYCGDVDALAPVLDELLPLLDELRLPWLLQWAALESALLPAARDDWGEARARVDRALELNRETGYGAYAGFFRAQRGWFARLAGDLDTALADGRQAVREASPTVHPWWYATAVGTCASTLLALGRPDEVAELCAAGLAALGDEAGAAYRLRCLAPLAAATGERREETDRLVAEIDCAPGRAWVTGADVYDALALAWSHAGEPERAVDVLGPLAAATRSGWPSLRALVAQRTSAISAAARSAPSSGTGR
jgi:tetratricopeptide (TPR) repeat protein